MPYPRKLACHANQKLHAAISAVEQSCNATCSCRPPPCSCTSGNCTKAQLKAAATTTCLPLLENVSRVYEQHLTTLLEYANSEGELGMVTEHEGGFARGGGNSGAAVRLQALGVDVPPSALPAKDYLGKPRLFVLSERTMVDPATEDALDVTVILLAPAAQLPSSLSLNHRKLNDAGAGAAFDSITMARVAPDRGVYRARVPLATATEVGGADLEYKVQAQVGSKALVYPAAGTVVVTAIPE